MGPEHQGWRRGKLGGGTRDTGSGEAGGRHRPVICTGGLRGPRVRATLEAALGRCGRSWSATLPRVPGPLESQGWVLRDAKLLPTSALKAARRGCGDTPRKPLSPKLACQTHSSTARVPHSNQ